MRKLSFAQIEAIHHDLDQREVLQQQMKRYTLESIAERHGIHLNTVWFYACTRKDEGLIMDRANKHD